MKFEDFLVFCNVGTEGKFELRLGWGLGFLSQKIIEKDL
jgi:hypothetical protein